MNPLLDKLKALPPRQIMMLGIGALLLFIFLDFFLLLTPQLAALNALDKKAVQLKSDIQTLTSNKQRMAQLQSGREFVRGQMADFTALVHKKDEIPQVLKKIFTLGNKYGIKIDRITPMPGTMQVVIANEYGKFSTMTVFVDLYSDLRRFGNFLRRLEKDKVFWKIDDFVLSGDETNPERQKFTVNLKIIIME